MGNNVYTCIDFHEFAFTSTSEISIVDFGVPEICHNSGNLKRHVSTEVGASNLGKHGISRYESSGKGSGGWKYPAEVPVSCTSCWTHGRHMLPGKNWTNAVSWPVLDTDTTHRDGGRFFCIDLGRCFWIVLEFRVVPVVGPLIIAVLQSFQPMIGMFSFMGTLVNIAWDRNWHLKNVMHCKMAKVWCLSHLPSPFSPWRMMTEVHLMFLGQILKKLEDHPHHQYISMKHTWVQCPDVAQVQRSCRVNRM